MTKQKPPYIFRPLPGQKEFMEALEPELLYSGSLGAGKTKVGLNKGLFLSTRYPGNEGLIVRKVAADLPSTTLKSWKEEVLPPDLIVEEHKTEHWMTIRTAGRQTSRIWWTGMDRVTRIGGTQFGWVFFDECVEAEEADWNMLLGRLRHPTVPFHQMMGATNPGPPTHFLYDRFWNRGLDRNQDGGLLRRKIEANSLANPFLPKSYRRLLEGFTGLYRDRFVLGKWVGFAGLVYGDFNPGVHIVPSHPIPKEWRRVCSVDFGGGHPFSYSWYAEEPTTNTWVQYRQIYMTGRTVHDLAGQIARLSVGEAIETTTADHDVSARLELNAAGIPTQPANKAVEQGIEKVQRRLQRRPNVRFVPMPSAPGGGYTFPEGAPGILFMDEALVEEDPNLLAAEKKRPLRTTHEFGYYKWSKSAQGVNKNVPVKEFDDGLDELRYFLMHADALDTMSFGLLDTDAEGRMEARIQASRQEARISTKEDRIKARLARRQQEGAKP